ncbi:hypothetical protein M758_8G040500 [Ceratodon purpureus]|nr:hypothetical protein M758_8G040500 [Ceratodon purpureus]
MEMLITPLCRPSVCGWYSAVSIRAYHMFQLLGKFSGRFSRRSSLYDASTQTLATGCAVNRSTHTNPSTLDLQSIQGFFDCSITVVDYGLDFNTPSNSSMSHLLYSQSFCRSKCDATSLSLDFTNPSQ